MQPRKSPNTPTPTPTPTLPTFGLHAFKKNSGIFYIFIKKENKRKKGTGAGKSCFKKMLNISAVKNRHLNFGSSYSMFTAMIGLLLCNCYCCCYYCCCCLLLFVTEKLFSLTTESRNRSSSSQHQQKMMNNRCNEKKNAD